MHAKTTGVGRPTAQILERRGLKCPFYGGAGGLHGDDDHDRLMAVAPELSSKKRRTSLLTLAAAEAAQGLGWISCGTHPYATGIVASFLACIPRKHNVGRIAALVGAGEIEN